MRVLEQSRLRSPYSGEATVDQVTRQNECCRVKFRGVYWSAEVVSPFPLHPDDLVKVVGRKNLALLIEPFSNGCVAKTTHFTDSSSGRGCYERSP